MLLVLCTESYLLRTRKSRRDVDLGKRTGLDGSALASGLLTDDPGLLLALSNETGES